MSPNTSLVERLAGWSGLSGLIEIGLDDARDRVSATVAVRLFESPNLSTRLSRLRVSGLCRSPEAVAALANCSALRGLRHLDFAFNDLSVASAAALATSPHLKHLEGLHTWSEWDEAGESARAWLVLADPRAFPRLRDVVVGSGTPEPLQEELRRRFGPRLRVFSDC